MADTQSSAVESEEGADSVVVGLGCRSPREPDSLRLEITGGVVKDGGGVSLGGSPGEASDGNSDGLGDLAGSGNFSIDSIGPSREPGVGGGGGDR